MSRRASRGGAAVVSILLIMGVLLVVDWYSTPAPSPAVTADRPPRRAEAAPPTHSIVFLVDSFVFKKRPREIDYFEMAREAMVTFLHRPELPTDGNVEVALLQYARREAAGYVEGDILHEGTFHWFRPVRITKAPLYPQIENSETVREGVVRLVEELEPSRHFTATLLESGLREAVRVLEEFSAGDERTEYHIVMLGSGEYRLATPCPPKGYCVATEKEDCPPAECESPEYALPDWPGDYRCNRVCHIRHYADMAHHAKGGRVRISCMHLGRMPRGRKATVSESSGSSEVEQRADADPSEVLTKSIEEGGTANPRPDHAALLQELAQPIGRGNESRPLAGHYVRVCTPPKPGESMDSWTCEGPGTAEDMAALLVQWIFGRDG